ADATADAIPVIPNFHPAYLRRGKASHQGVFARVMQRALNVAAGRDHDWLWGVDPDGIGVCEGLHYRLNPSLDEAGSFIALMEHLPNEPVAYDIETSESASLDEDAREGFVDTEIR